MFTSFTISMKSSKFAPVNATSPAIVSDARRPADQRQLDAVARLLADLLVGADAVDERRDQDVALLDGEVGEGAVETAAERAALGADLELLRRAPG